MVNEPRKLGHVKVNKLIQVMYCDRVELRGIGSCREVLQIFAEAVEPERSVSTKMTEKSEHRGTCVDLGQ